jgi:hypothetical protein
MTISLYEKFTGIDWERIAGSAGTALVLICLSAGVLDAFLGGSFQNSFFLLLVGLVTAIWEMPSLFVFIPQCASATEFATTALKLSVPAARAVVYLLLAFLFLRGSASDIIVGLVFLVCSMLNIFAQINFHSDLQDGTANAGGAPAAAASSEHADSKQELLEKKKTPGFGTF